LNFALWILMSSICCPYLLALLWSLLRHFQKLNNRHNPLFCRLASTYNWLPSFWCDWDFLKACLVKNLVHIHCLYILSLGGRLMMKYGLQLFLLVVTNFLWLWTSWLPIPWFTWKNVFKQNRPRCWNHKNGRATYTSWVWYGGNRPHGPYFIWQVSFWTFLKKLFELF